MHAPVSNGVIQSTIVMDRAQGSQRFQIASVLLFSALLLLVLLTFRSYGISWDEGVHEKYGIAILRYYLGMLRGQPDETVLELGNPVAYGGIFNLVTALIQKFSPLGRFETRHLVNAMVGLFGILGCWKTARLVAGEDIAGERVAFWAALFLAIIPGYYSHMFFNPKDIPFAAGYIWSLYFLLKWMREFPDVSWSTIAWLSLAIGLTQGMRIGGIMLLGYLGLMTILESVSVIRPPRPDRWTFLFRRAIVPVLLVAVISYGIMVFTWPWALQDPLVNPFRALSGQQSIDYEFLVLYRGHAFPGDGLPWDYLPGYILVTLPGVVLLLLAVGVLLGIVGLRLSRRAGSLFTFQSKAVLLLIFAIAFPIVYAILQRPVLYDGARHFMFVLPPLACLAAYSFQSLNERFAQGRTVPQWASPAFSLVVFLLVGWQVFDMARLFPYEYIYYNSLVGGVKGAYQKYETDYWGLSTSEAARWLSDYLAEKGTPEAKAYPVYTCAGKASASHYYSENLKVVQSPDRAHFGIVITRWDCDQELPGEILYTIERMGVPLAQVKELY